MQYDIYRAGMDVAPASWPSFMANLASLTTQLNKQTLHPVGKGNWPHSRPGCWAYFDSVHILTRCYHEVEAATAAVATTRLIATM